MKNQIHPKKDEGISFNMKFSNMKSSNPTHISFSIKSKFNPMTIRVIQIKLLKNQCHKNRNLTRRVTDKELNKSTRTLKIKIIT